MIRVYDEAGNVIETHESPGDFHADHSLAFRLTLGAGCLA